MNGSLLSQNLREAVRLIVSKKGHKLTFLFATDVGLLALDCLERVSHVLLNYDCISNL